MFNCLIYYKKDDIDDIDIDDIDDIDDRILEFLGLHTHITFISY